MILLIDGNNLAHRVYHTYQGSAFAPNFIKAVDALVTDMNADDAAMAWDRKLEPGSKNFRDIFTEYKAQREKTPEIIELYRLIEKLALSVDRLGVKQFCPCRLEGDDVLAWLTTKFTERRILISTDKDLLQLVSEEVHHFDTIRRRYTTLKNFEELHQVPKEWFLDYKCVLGDRSDNVPGVYGIGPKKFFKYTDRNGLVLERFTEEQQKIIERNRVLMGLDRSWLLEKGELESYEEQWTVESQKELKSHSARELLLINS